MKLDEFKTGMTVVDKHHNNYEVVKVSGCAKYDPQPIKLRFVECDKDEANPFWFDVNYTRENHTDSEWWICSQYLKHLFSECKN